MSYLTYLRGGISMSNLVLPHGGKVLPLLASGNQWENGIKEAEALLKVRLNSREVFDLR